MIAVGVRRLYALPDMAGKEAFTCRPVRNNCAEA